jgi:hypothetical protein
MTTKAPGYVIASFASSLRSLNSQLFFKTSPRLSSTQNLCLLSPRSRPMVTFAFRNLRVVFSISIELITPLQSGTRMPSAFSSNLDDRPHHRAQKIGVLGHHRFDFLCFFVNSLLGMVRYFSWLLSCSQLLTMTSLFAEPSDARSPTMPPCALTARAFGVSRSWRLL